MKFKESSMTSRRLAVSALIIGVTALGSMAAAQDQTPAAADTSTRSILSVLHTSNEANIQAGTLAQQQGSSEPVRQLGKQLVDDHQTLDKKVLAIAEEKGIDLVAKQHSGPTSGLAGLGETV